jgi:SagB-type dehydrogenase family enzyme
MVQRQGQIYVMRTVPSAGARHPFETYLLANRVTGLDPGLYRYLPVDHQLCSLETGPDLVGSMHSACFEQYVVDSAVTIVWTAIPHRTEWRYATLSPKLIALDAGHVCQNLYLAATAIGAGACAIGAYNQAAMDAVLGVDGEDEFVIYMATVGRVK